MIELGCELDSYKTIFKSVEVEIVEIEGVVVFLTVVADKGYFSKEDCLVAVLLIEGYINVHVAYLPDDEFFDKLLPYIQFIK